MDQQQNTLLSVICYKLPITNNLPMEINKFIYRRNPFEKLRFFFSFLNISGNLINIQMIYVQVIDHHRVGTAPKKQLPFYVERWPTTSLPGHRYSDVLAAAAALEDVRLEVVAYHYLTPTNSLLGKSNIINQRIIIFHFIKLEIINNDVRLEFYHAFALFYREF